MTRDASEVVMAVLLAAFELAPSDDTIRAWYDWLAPLDAETAREAARNLAVDGGRVFPLFEQFQYAYAAVARRQGAQMPQDRPEPAAATTAQAPRSESHTEAVSRRTPKAEALAIINGLRDSLGVSAPVVALPTADGPTVGRLPLEGAHDPRRCRPCLLAADREAGRSFHVPIPTLDDAPIAAGDPAVPEPPSDYEV